MAGKYHLPISQSLRSPVWCHNTVTVQPPYIEMSGGGPAGFLEVLVVRTLVSSDTYDHNTDVYLVI